MLLTADETHVAVPSTVILILLGSTVFGFGYAAAVMKRARLDLRTTKAALPGLRKSFWKALWTTVKVGAVITVAGIVLLVWAWHEIRGNSAGAKTSPSPSPSVSVSRHTPRGHSTR